MCNSSGYWCVKKGITALGIIIETGRYCLTISYKYLGV